MLRRLTELACLWRQRRLPAAKLERLQLRKLRVIVRHAAENVPFYRELYKSAGVHSVEIRTLDDLRRLPITSKRDIRMAGQAAVSPARAGDGPRVSDHTSGYSGETLTVWMSGPERRRKLLREFRALLSIGFRPLDRLAILGPEDATPRGWHERAGFFRTEIIPAVLPVGEQLRRLAGFSPSILWAYPTVLRAVAAEAGWRLGDLIHPRILITSAQVFRPVFRDRVLADLGAEPFIMYAATEVGRIGVECPAHRGLHVDADAVLVEILDGGQVVVTSLDAFTMPFIRYRLGDLSGRVDEACPCGCAFPLVQAPQGRDADMVRLPSGRTMSCAVLDYTLRGVDWIEQYRFVQERRDLIVVLLVTRPRPDDTTRDALRRRLEAGLDEPVGFDIRLVDEIPDDGAKFKPFVSRL